MKIRRSLLRDLVIVESYSGEGAYGPAFAGPIMVKVNIDSTRRLVRNTAGDQVISEATLIVHPEPRDEDTGATLSAVTLFTPESKITLGGRVATVLGVSENTVRGGLVFLKVTVT